jgi:hypothetical protein
MRTRLLAATVAVALTACHPNPSQPSVEQLRDLKRELAQLREENRTLRQQLTEAQARYGISLEGLSEGEATHSAIFDRVFSETKGDKHGPPPQ